MFHAKAVVSDEGAVFVTSANLTEAGFDRNIELEAAEGPVADPGNRREEPFPSACRRKIDETAIGASRLAIPRNACERCEGAGAFAGRVEAADRLCGSLARLPAGHQPPICKEKGGSKTIANRLAFMTCPGLAAHIAAYVSRQLTNCIASRAGIHKVSYSG